MWTALSGRGDEWFGVFGEERTSPRVIGYEHRQSAVAGGREETSSDRARPIGGVQGFRSLQKKSKLGGFHDQICTTYGPKDSCVRQVDF